MRFSARWNCPREMVRLTEADRQSVPFHRRSLATPNARSPRHVRVRGTKRDGVRWPMYVRTRQHGNADVFLFVFFCEVDTYSYFAKTCYLVLSIHIAENAVTMIMMTTVLLCFKGFFAPQISRRLSRIFFNGRLAAKPHYFRGRRSACYKSRPAD